MDPLSGEFRLGMITTIGPYLSPLVLPPIRLELPDLSLVLMAGLTRDLETHVASGKLDGAILATVPVEPHLEDIVLYDEPFWIALPNGHRLARQQAIDINELAAEELLLLADGHCLRDQVLDLCQANAGSGDSKTNTRETSLATLLALVEAGDGVTLAPALTRPAASRGENRLVMRPEASGTAGRIVRLVYRASFPRTEVVHRLAAIIRSNVPETMVGVAN